LIKDIVLILIKIGIFNGRTRFFFNLSWNLYFIVAFLNQQMRGNVQYNVNQTHQMQVKF